MSKTVDNIYNLIKQDTTRKVFDENQELFKEFFYHDMIASFNGFKVIEIYKYLLSLNLEDDNELLPYINSKIIDDFNHYEQNITQSPYMKDFQANPEYIELIYKLIEAYEYIKQYSSKSQLTKIISDKKFVRDYTASMMIILNKSFFKLDKEIILKMFNSICNNSYLKDICDNGMGKQLQYKDYIFEYCSRYLFTKEFVNYDSLKDDYLLKSLKEGKIKDADLVQRIIKKLDIDYLIMICDDNLSKYLDMLEKVSSDRLFQTTLFNHIYNLVFNEDDIIILLNFIMEDQRANTFLTSEQREMIIQKTISIYPASLNDKQVLYLLKQSNNTLFKVNIKETIKGNKWSKETNEFIQSQTKDIPNTDISFDEAIKLLDGMFKGNKLDKLTCFACLKALIKKFVGDDNFTIHLGNYEQCSGYMSFSNNCISVGLNGIKEFIACSNVEANPGALYVLDTVFHEAQHLKQFRLMMQKDLSDEAYAQYKEWLLTQLLNGYYKKNYWGINFEKEARVVGAQSVYNLINTYFPYLKQCSSYYQSLANSELKKDYGDKKIFELSDEISIDEALEKMIVICPSIVKKNPILLREYDENGIKKQQDIKKI